MHQGSRLGMRRLCLFWQQPLGLAAEQRAGQVTASVSGLAAESRASRVEEIMDHHQYS